MGGRSARVVAAVLQATRTELAAVGYGALSIERVAELAGVARTTVYRRYPNKRDLVQAALVEMARTVSLPADRGDLVEELTELAFTQARTSQQADGKCIVRILYGESGNPEVREIVRELRKAKLARPLEVLRRAVRRGELSPDTDGTLTWQMIVGTIHLRSHLLGERLSRASIRKIVTAALYGTEAREPG